MNPYEFTPATTYTQRSRDYHAGVRHGQRIGMAWALGSSVASAIGATLALFWRL